jgi:hypothetical protein
LDCEQSNIELAMTAVASTKLEELWPNAPPSSSDPAIPSMTRTFNIAEDAKVIQIDDEDPTKIVQIGAD